MTTFSAVVTSEQALRELIQAPHERAVAKQLAALDDHCRAFIARSPFLLLATANAAGQCDVSPKGDAPGFVQVLDDRRLAIPDRPGNRRLDGMRNILANPHVGLIFLIPGKEETLRVNGRAWIVRDRPLLDAATVGDKRPLLAIGVEVEEAFLHCPKAFKRSRLWEPAAWPDLSDLAPWPRMLHDHTRTADRTVEELARELEESSKRLY